MTDQVPPCTQGLDEDCFKAMPVWAKQAFAYRLLMLITPKQLTKRLSRRLFRLILPPGVLIPPGVEPPPGMVVPPGSVFPPGWTTGDPLPPGTIPPGTLPPGTDQTGTTPPLYTAPWSPGPVSTPGGAVGVVPWMWDTFDGPLINPLFWNDASQSNGVASIESGRLKMVAPAMGDVAGVNWTTPEPTQPDTFTWQWDLNHISGTGQILNSIFTGAHWLFLIWEAPTTLSYMKAGGGSTVVTIASITGTTDTWTLEYNGTTITVYQGATKVVDNKAPMASASAKGTRFFTLSDDCEAYLDNYFIWET